MTATMLSKSLPANSSEQTFCSIPIVHLHKTRSTIYQALKCKKYSSEHVY